LFPNLSTIKVPTSLLKNSQRIRLLSSLKSLNNHKGHDWLVIINSHKEESNINFSGLNHKLGSSRAMPNYLGDESSRVINTNEVIAEDAEVPFLEIKAHSKK
jgi:hypothetical protein